jgi:REP element-mobilizing transposase RayT
VLVDENEMARKLRLEYEGAMYHVINRGNYRAAVFGEEGARRAFMECLGEACEKAGWVVHAYVLMSNHYHLALETPRGNLVEGMRWLQSTFANRFNRYRGENGHVFQGRYKALVVEGSEGLGAVAHYIHLNPVRAKIVPMGRLVEYRASSYAGLMAPKKRPSWLRVKAFLQAAGELTDTTAGRRKYAQYLAWLAENEPGQKQLKFESMSKGWALGGEAFRLALVKDHRAKLAHPLRQESSTREARELLWTEALQAAMVALSKTAADVERDIKSAPWKVAIATQLKSTSTVSNVWLAERLRMGAPDGVSRYVGEVRRGLRKDAERLIRKIAAIRV